MLTESEDYRYELQDDWMVLPDDKARADLADVGVDTRGFVYLFSRSGHQVMVLDADGTFSHAWGDEQTFPKPHAVTMGPDNTIWLTDIADHTARKCTLDGEIILTLGRSRLPSPAFSGLPFNQCTHVAIDPNDGCVYVTDGYTNGAVHKFTPAGRYLLSWGEPGNKPGQFCLPHNVATDSDGFVYVADRHNARVQVFSRHGELEDVWYGMGLPCALHIDANEQLAYMIELGAMTYVVKASYAIDPGWSTRPGLGHRVTVRSLDGTLLAELLHNGTGTGPGQMIGPHGIAVDDRGNILIAELAYAASGHDDPSARLPTLRRLRRMRPDRLP